ncbi:MAG: kelch repeat-containing protein [Minicystis sp.]
MQRSPAPKQPSPGLGWEASAAFDPKSKLWIHHAGHDGIPQGNQLFTFDLDTQVWAQRFPDNSPDGACVVDGAGAVDTLNDRFVRFPGGTLGHGYLYSRGVKLKQSKAWLYDVAHDHWTNMRPPPYDHEEPYSPLTLGYENAAATFDDRHGLFVHFGGINAGGGTNNLHLYDAYSNDWARMELANPPAPRDGSGLAYNAKNDVVVVFGGQYLDDGTTWVYRPGKMEWEGKMLSPRPPTDITGSYSTIPKMACRTDADTCLAITWKDTIETWELDTKSWTWTKLDPEAIPTASKSRARNLAYDPWLDAYVLEQYTVDGLTEVWTYRPPSAAEATGVQPPPSNLTVATTSTGAELAWERAPGAVSYRVRRGQGKRAVETTLTDLATTNCPTYADTGLSPGETYHYEVVAVDAQGHESIRGARGRTEPRVLVEPVVSVLATTHVQVSWDAHPAADVVGYNVYRGLVTVNTVIKGKPAPWADNDPDYGKPYVSSVDSIGALTKLNDAPIAKTAFDDTSVDLGKKGPESKDYEFAVHAYVIRAVNRLGVESGPSPYALTLASEPRSVLLREQGGSAEIQWKSLEKGLQGFMVYRLADTFTIVQEGGMVSGTTVTVPGLAGETRFWIAAVDAIGQVGQPSSAVWYQHTYDGFFQGGWHQ